MAAPVTESDMPTETSFAAPAVRPSASRMESVEATLTQEVLTRQASFPQLAPGAGLAGTMPLGFLLDVPVTLTAELGRTTLTLGEVLRLGSGSVVSLDRSITEPVELTARGVLLARGEVVIVDDRFAIRIKEIVQQRRAGGEAG